MSDAVRTPFAVTHGRVLAIAAPMTVASITTPLLGIVGTAIIGRLGEAHLLGAVAMSGVIFDCIFWLFGFLRMGTVALTAQAFGANDGKEQRAVLARALLLAAALGLVFVALQGPIAWAVYRLMGASEAVTSAAETYFFLRIWSTPFALANYALLGWLVGLARPLRALLLQVLINSANVALTAVLVLHFDMGVAGAGAATVAAEAVGTLAGLAIAWSVAGRRIDLTRSAVFDRARLMRLFTINRDIMLRTAALITAWGFFAAQGARAGDAVLAANSVLHNLVLTGAFFLDGFAAAAEQLCGRATGGRNRAAFGRAAWLATGWGFGFGLATTAIFLLTGPWLIALMTTHAEVRAIAQDYLIWAALTATIGVFAFSFDGIYIGATWTDEMRNLMLASLALYFAAWWLMLPLGNTGLWLAILVFLGARGLLQAVRYPALMRRTFAA